MRHSVQAVCLFLLVISVLAACGGRKHLNFDDARRQPTPADVRAEIDALTLPEGVDPTVWAELKKALSGALERFGTTRRVSSAPSSPASKVPDFSLDDFSATSAAFSWSYRSQGDYDQNGEVNPADLVVIAANFLKTTASPDWPGAQVGDGDSNGEVNAADISSIAANFRNGVTGFVIQQSSDPDEPSSWTAVAWLPLALGIKPEAGGFLRFEHVVAAPVSASYYRVASYFGDPEAAPEIGIPSDAVMTAELQPPTGVSATLGAFSDRVRVSWEAAEDAVGYRVYRGEDELHLAEIDAETLFWDDLTLSDYERYDYRLTALYPGGESAVSPAVEGFRAMRGEWWMFGRDAQHTRASQYQGPVSNDLSWARRQPDSSFNLSSPALGADGTLYIGSAAPGQAGLQAFAPDGSFKWQYSVPTSIQSSPAVGADGTIYIGFYSSPGGLAAVNSDGSERWTFPLANSGVYSSPVIAPDGTIYVGSLDGLLYAINPNGTLRWGKPLGAPSFGAPVLDAAGNIYIATDDSQLWAISPNGDEIWPPFTADGTFIDGSPTISEADGLVYFGTFGGIYYAVNLSSGKERWNYPAGIGFFAASPALYADGTSLIPAFDGTLYALNSNGTLQWSYPVGAPIYGSPALDVDGNAYMADTLGRVVCVNSAGQLVWERELGVQIMTSGAIAGDGTLYLGSIDGYLFAFGPAPTTPPSAPTGLTATDGTLYQAIRLTWDRAYDATGYEVYRDGGATPVATVGEVQTWTDEGLLDADPHTYQIRATNDFGSSEPGSAAVGSASNEPPGPGDWPMFGRDSAHTRLSTLAGPQSGNYAWSAVTGGPIYSSPVVGSNGEIYIGSDDANLYCFNGDGSERWSYTADDDIGATPAIGPDGTIYVGTFAGTLLAISPTGGHLWDFPTGGSIYSSCNLKDGVLYFGSADGKLYAVDVAGDEVWSYEAGGEIISTPAIGSDGSIYFGTVAGSSVISLDTAGGFQWSFPAGGAVRSSPAVKHDQINGDLIYFGTMSNDMVCIDATGGEEWRFPTGGAVFSSPGIAPDGAICFGSVDGFVYALNPDGSEKWSEDMFAPVTSSPAIDSAGRVFIGDTGGFMNVISASGEYLWWASTLGQVLESSPALGPGGYAYVGDSSGILNAFGPTL